MALIPVQHRYITGIVWFTNGYHIFGWQVFEGGNNGVALGGYLICIAVTVSTIGV